MSSLPAWSAAPPAPRPPPGVAYVLRFGLDVDERTQATLAGWLSPDEQQRAARYRPESVRRRFVVARATLRSVLGAALARPPATLRFVAGPHGKPALAGEPPPLRFNLSHSGELALVALGLDRELGVDVERRRRHLDHLSIARRFFAPDEVAALAALPQAQQEAAFYRCWTRKEALLKALGAGLTLPLAGFAVSVTEASPRLLRTDWDASEAQRWRLFHLEPDPGATAALAVAAAFGEPEPAIRQFDWGPAEARARAEG